MQTKIEKQRKCSQCVFIAMPIDFQPWTTFFPSMPKSPFSVLRCVFVALLRSRFVVLFILSSSTHNPATPSRNIQQTSLQFLVCCCRVRSCCFRSHNHLFYSFQFGVSVGEEVEKFSAATQGKCRSARVHFRELCD